MLLWIAVIYTNVKRYVDARDGTLYLLRARAETRLLRFTPGLLAHCVSAFNSHA